MKKLLAAVTVFAGLLTLPVLAKDKVTIHQVHFDKGKSGTTVQGSIKGYDSVLYKLSAKAGQTMQVSIDSKHADFNVYVPGKGLGDQALFVGEPGIPYMGNLPANGTYTIAVYLMRNEARRGTKSNYKLHIGIQ